MPAAVPRAAPKDRHGISRRAEDARKDLTKVQGRLIQPALYFSSMSNRDELSPNHFLQRKQLEQTGGGLSRRQLRLGADQTGGHGAAAGRLVILLQLPSGQARLNRRQGLLLQGSRFAARSQILPTARGVAHALPSFRPDQQSASQ